MAIEIIPKKIKRTLPLKEALLYLSLLIFIAVAASYFVINSFAKKAEAEKQRLENEIAKIEVTDLEKGLQQIQKKIKDAAPLLESHVFSSKIFGLVEGKTHPKVFFTQFSLDSKTAKLTVSGQTESFVEVGQQILILAAEPAIQTLELSQIGISKDGKVEFSLNLSLDPKIFSF